MKQPTDFHWPSFTAGMAGGAITLMLVVSIADIVLRTNKGPGKEYTRGFYDGLEGAKGRDHTPSAEVGVVRCDDGSVLAFHLPPGWLFYRSTSPTVDAMHPLSQPGVIRVADPCSESAKP